VKQFKKINDGMSFYWAERLGFYVLYKMIEDIFA